MFKERVKTSIIVLLLLNCVFLTFQLWFKSGVLGSDWPYFSWEDLPFVRFFIGEEELVSVPKENLSKPRKIVINGGDLWIPYYNTDEAFDTLDEKTSDILRSVLKGEWTNSEQITYEEWLDYLSSPSVYIEYPITVTPSMLSMILNTSFDKFPEGIIRIKDAIIIPDGDTAVKVALRDANSGRAVEFLIENEELSFPDEVLAMYADKYARDEYEFAYSARLNDALADGVAIGDLVLFSDNESAYPDIKASNPLEGKEFDGILKSFLFKPKPLRYYTDNSGANNYVENYATVRILPDGYIEYTVVDKEKGIDLGKDEDNEYELLNSAIDFTEKVWNSISDKPLNVLVSGIEKTENGHKFTLDYYCSGREVAVGIERDGIEPLYHGVEIEIYENRIVSYRQYVRLYEETDSVTSQENFVAALDYFFVLFADREEVTITDIYPGYFDNGDGSEVIKTTWLSEVNDSDERYPKR